jgi:methylmalonyl-CoA epimerase
MEVKVMRVEKIDRIAIATRDVNKAKERLENIFGIKFDKVLEDEELGVRALFSNIGLELAEPASPNSPLATFLQKKGEGVYAIVIKTSDINSLLSELRAKGVRITNDFKIGYVREVVLHPKDTCNVMFILCEYPEHHPACVAMGNKLRSIP